MTDLEGAQFLQWCLPRLHLRWPGFRKVRRQVYKRLNRRLQELDLPNLQSYRRRLEDHPGEWATLDSLCWIHISRFYRDRSVFQHLERELLPQLAERQVAAGEGEIRCWSAGCAGGEEPYTLAIIWRHCLAQRFPSLRLRIIATDIDHQAIRRAERACYKASSVKELPAEWRTEAFVTRGEELCLKDDYRACVTFLPQDIRDRAAEGTFHLVLCRNLAFTYFDETLQKETIQKITDRLAPGGALIIGNLESLPDGPWEVEPWSKRLGVYRTASIVSSQKKSHRGGAEGAE
ncbi:MAG: chemotaxis protein CheR [Deltaproteobacteria bacterium]|nr:chemotaxis protein CheR [Deltaproteobacteria bacterium]